MAIMAGYIPPEQQWSQQVPQGGTDVMNGSFQDEVQKQQEDLIARARAEAIKQDPTLNYVQRQLAQGLLGAKMDWQRAYDAGDANGMATAALNAQDLRKRAESIGWNGNGYGSDVSLLEAAQNLANNDTRAVNDILYNLKDSNDIYQQKVVDYLDKGYSIDSAKRMAGQRSNEATANNVNQLKDAFRMYGMDERGAITPQGADILASLGLNGQGELANYYANMLAKPVQNWQFENSLITADRGQQNALNRMALQNEYNTLARREGFQQAKDMAVLNHELSAQQQADVARLRMATAQMGREQAYNFAIEKLTEAGYTPQEAATMALSAITGHNPAKGQTEKQPPRTTQGVYNQLADLLETAQNDIATGAIYEMPDGEGSVEAYRQAVENAIAKGHLTGEDVTKARDYAYMLQYMLAMNADTPDTEWAKKAYDNMSPDFKKENATAIAGIKPKAQQEADGEKGSSWEKKDRGYTIGGKY